MVMGQSAEKKKTKNKERAALIIVAALFYGSLLTWLWGYLEHLPHGHK
jgi:hypothetical protein